MIVRVILAFVFLATTAEAQEIKIGAILHITSDVAMQSSALREGIEVGIEELNESGADGTKFKLVLVDAKAHSKNSYEGAKKLIHFDKVKGALLSDYMDAMTDGPLFEKAAIPAITLWDAGPEIEALGYSVFGMGPWTPASGELPAEYTISVLGKKKAALVFNREPWSEKVAASFKLTLRKLGGELVQEFPINPDEVDFRSVLTRIKQGNAEVVYAPISYGILTFYREARELGLPQIRIGSDTVTDEHIAQAPQAFEGVFQTNLPIPDSEIYEELSNRYKKRFSKEITLPWFVAMGYDAVRVLGHALRSADGDAARARNELYQVRNFSGATSRITFNERGSAPQFPRMYKVEKGRFIPADSR